MYIDELLCNKKRQICQILRKVKQAPTNLVAGMWKLTFKQNLTHFETLMKDTVSRISILKKNDIMAKTNQIMGHIGCIHKIFGNSRGASL